MEGKTIFAASALSFSGGILNLLVSVIRLYSPWFLTCISGVGIIIASVVLHVNLSRKALWGGIMFIYSNLGFVAFGLSPEKQLLAWGLAAFLLSLVGAALILSHE